MKKKPKEEFRALGRVMAEEIPPEEMKKAIGGKVSKCICVPEAFDVVF